MSLHLAEKFPLPLTFWQPRGLKIGLLDNWEDLIIVLSCPKNDLGTIPPCRDYMVAVPIWFARQFESSILLALSNTVRLCTSVYVSAFTLFCTVLHSTKPQKSAMNLLATWKVHVKSQLHTKVTLRRFWDCFLISKPPLTRKCLYSAPHTYHVCIVWRKRQYVKKIVLHRRAYARFSVSKFVVFSCCFVGERATLNRLLWLREKNFYYWWYVKTLLWYYPVVIVG